MGGNVHDKRTRKTWTRCFANTQRSAEWDLGLPQFQAFYLRCKLKRGVIAKIIEIKLISSAYDYHYVRISFSFYPWDKQM